jgi:hypothetical protein
MFEIYRARDFSRDSAVAFKGEAGGGDQRTKTHLGFMAKATYITEDWPSHL